MSKNYSLDATPPNDQRIPEYVRDDDWIRRFLHQAHIGRRVADEIPERIEYIELITHAGFEKTFMKALFFNP